MGLFKKVAKKVTTDVKDVIKEEASKTTDEIKKGVINTLIDILPYALAFAGAAVLFSILRKPVPITVKIVIDHV